MGQKTSSMLSICLRDQTNAVTPNIPTPMVCQAEAVTPNIPTPMVCQAEAVTPEIHTEGVCHCLCSLPSGAKAASSFFYSTRIAELSKQRSKFGNQLDFDVESSTSHWTTVTAATAKSDESNEQVHNRLQNRVVFEKLKKHPVWGPFFRRHPYEFRIGPKIAEGGQAEIYEALGKNKDDRRGMGNPILGGNGIVCLAVKVFKDGFPLDQLQTFCPPGLAYAPFPDNIGRGPICWALGAQLLKDGRFAFIFDRYEGDLRKHIDKNMLGRNGCPPFSSSKTHRCILSIAEGMFRLHGMGVLHNDLKAANVLVERHIKGYGGRVKFGVADFESSVGIEGTGFWRAPEVLLALKNRNLHQETFTRCTTQQSDVYSFAMTCYEIITGRMPFEGEDVQNYDIILRGERPILPSYPFARYNDLVRRCWHQDPRQRPSFAEIVNDLDVNGLYFRDMYSQYQYLPNCYHCKRYRDYIQDG